MSIRTILKRWRERPDAASSDAEPVAAVVADNARAAELLQLGVSQRECGALDEAARALMRAIELEYDCGKAHYELGLVYHDQSRFEDAADCFHLAAHFGPRAAATHLALGAALIRLGRYTEAETAYRRAIELEPQSAAAWFQAGNACKLQGRLEQAVECYRAATARDSELVDAECQLAFVLFKMGRYAESHASHAAVLAARPDFTEAHHNLGLLLLETGHPEEALASFERAAALRPGTLETQACIAHALRDLNRLDEAIMQYDTVLARQPQFGDAVLNRGYALLMQENYAAGWTEYERRFAATGTPERNFPYRAWRGESLNARRILVYAEQGLGDEIMFASCLPEVLQRAGHVIVECNTRLARLFARSFPQATVHGGEKADTKAWLRALPQPDVQTAIGSLPLYLRGGRDAFPAHQGYLCADVVRVDAWRARFAASGGRLRIGIVWRGGSLRSRQFTRSIPLPNWRPLLAQNDITFVSLQHGGTVTDEAAQLNNADAITVLEFEQQFANLDELAAAITALDLVISVDTMAAHLAGALGKPVWVLLSNAPEWRYRRAGATMPWYPSARLFRQERPGDWTRVVAQVSDALQRFVPARGT